MHRCSMEHPWYEGLHQKVLEAKILVTWLGPGSLDNALRFDLVLRLN